MTPALPEGEPVPRDGALPAHLAGERSSDFGVYVHVPFCRVRCGYCDFNTYTATELGGGANQARYASTAVSEIALARRVMTAAGVERRPVSTVFFGGGTPTLLPAADLVAMLRAVQDTWGLLPDAEVTTEANPDSVDREYLATLATGGFTRISFGMQSAVPHVLATLERTHDPAGVPDAVAWAREAGLEVSVDLIYGTPGESLEDWRTSLLTAIDMQPDHISAYALTIEPGTKLAAQVRRGELAAPTGDDEADKYELADDLLAQAGYHWYEISNWARSLDGGDDPGRLAVCRHNLAYWRGHDWWGIGPGAHSYIGPPYDVHRDSPAAGQRAYSTTSGVRWWNVKHPLAYAKALDEGRSPAAGREILTAEQAELERVMLAIRLADGMAVTELPDTGATSGTAITVAALVADGLIDGRAAIGGTVVLTRRGRLLADTVVARLTGM